MYERELTFLREVERGSREPFLFFLSPLSLTAGGRRRQPQSAVPRRRRGLPPEQGARGARGDRGDGGEGAGPRRRERRGGEEPAPEGVAARAAAAAAAGCGGGRGGGRRLSGAAAVRRLCCQGKGA